MQKLLWIKTFILNGTILGDASGQMLAPKIHIVAVDRIRNVLRAHVNRLAKLHIGPHMIHVIVGVEDKKRLVRKLANGGRQIAKASATVNDCGMMGADNQIADGV